MATSDHSEPHTCPSPLAAELATVERDLRACRRRLDRLGLHLAAADANQAVERVKLAAQAFPAPR